MSLQADWLRYSDGSLQRLLDLTYLSCTKGENKLPLNQQQGRNIFPHCCFPLNCRITENTFISFVFQNASFSLPYLYLCVCSRKCAAVSYSCVKILVADCYFSLVVFNCFSWQNFSTSYPTKSKQNSAPQLVILIRRMRILLFMNESTVCITKNIIATAISNAKRKKKIIIAQQNLRYGIMYSVSSVARSSRLATAISLFRLKQASY